MANFTLFRLEGDDGMDDIEKNAEQFLPVVLKSQKELPDYVRKTLLKLLQTANQDIYSLFFPAATKCELDNTVRFDEWSVRYVSMVIALSQCRRDIANKINSAGYNGISAWVQMNRTWAGRAIFEKYLRERLVIPDDMSEKNRYFEYVVERVTVKDYITLTKAVSAVNSPIPAQLVIEALQSLDFEYYGRVIIAWQKEGSFTKTHPDWDLCYLLEHYPWLDDYLTDVFRPDISKNIEETIRSKPNQVEAWIESAMGPRRYGLLKVG